MRLRTRSSTFLTTSVRQEQSLSACAISALSALPLRPRQLARGAETMRPTIGIECREIDSGLTQFGSEP